MKSGTLAQIIAILAITSFLLIAGTRTQIASADNEILITRGKTVTISITLLQNGTFGDPVPGQIVEFFDQSNNILLGTNRTNSLGVAAFKWNIPSLHPLGLTTLNATFRGNSSLFLLPTHQCQTVNIMASTQMTLTRGEFFVAPSDTVNIGVTLVDDTDTPIDGAIINVVSGNITVKSSYTNASGQTAFSLVCNTTWLSLGSNIIEIVYPLNLSRHLEGTTEYIEIGMYQIESIISPNEYNTNPFLGDSLEIQLTLSSDDGPLSFSPISILLEGIPLINTTTDLHGNCTTELLINDNFQLGMNTLVVEYLGTSRYTSNQVAIPVSVSTYLHLNINAMDVAYAGEEVVLEISATDTLNRPIPDYSMNITDLSTDTSTLIEFPFNESSVLVSLQIAGPPGNHSILFQSKFNDFISNGSSIIYFDVWSKPNFSLISSNVDYFAIPSQIVSLEVRASNWLGNFSLQPIAILFDGIYSQSVSTDSNGIITITTTVPSSEGFFNISFFIEENLEAYRKSVHFDYVIEVTRKIPVTVNMKSYEIVSPLKKIVVRLDIMALNGTPLRDVKVTFEWQGQMIATSSLATGLIEIHLQFPPTDGSHLLRYSLQSTWSIESVSGFFVLTVTSLDILSANGLGIEVVVLSLFGSISLAVIPVIAKRVLAI